jgi:cephalosporin-C deacetylase-like acetyl esterase
MPLNTLTGEWTLEPSTRRWSAAHTCLTWLLACLVPELAGTLPGGFIDGGTGTAAMVWAQDHAPPLPDTDGAVEVPAQEWPLRPGPRTVRVRVHYPQGRLSAVGPRTGLFLTLHNWGGTDCVGTANPAMLAERCDCVALCVNYLQSGPRDSIEGPEPYDFGWLQALDSLRALHWVWQGLRQQQIAFDDSRVYVTGGSGGGNVSLMANKLAPRTFAAVFDICGMAKLSDDIAFHLPGGSELNARYQRDPTSPSFLSRDRQELHFVGHPAQLAKQKELGQQARIHVIHGVTDDVCPIADAREMIANFQTSGLNVVPVLVDQAMLDGKVFTGTGHSLGDRTEIVLQVGGAGLDPRHDGRWVRRGPTDFERRDDAVRYRTSRGEWVVSYRQGWPEGRFVPDPAPPGYPEHLDLTYRLTTTGERLPLRTPTDWAERRRQLVSHFERAAGEFPGPARKVPLEMKILEEVREEGLIRRKLSYRTEHDSRVTAWLLLPDRDSEERRPAALCLQQTTDVGKDEPAGVRGDPELHYALELARRGWVTLSPDYPSFGEHAWDFATHPEYASGTMKAIWDNVCAVDLLQGLPGVDPERIAVIGHSLGGHNAIFTALFEPRLKAVVSSCGFCTFTRDDIPSWTGPRYMPRIAEQFGNDVSRVPFDFPELVAAIAPRPFLAIAATQDSDFDVEGVRQTLASARAVYDLLGVGDRLQADYPVAPHSFPRASREAAYRFLEQALGHR